MKEIFRSAFHQSGRVSHLVRILAWHPTYYEVFSQELNVVMSMPSGPLQRHVRCYIAIMASAKMRCTYLVDEQEKEFLRVKGDPVWLGGVHMAPKKIQNLQHLNALMGATPWMVAREHIEALTKGEDAWSVAELMHALVILSTFHALSGPPSTSSPSLLTLSGLVWSMGIAPEVDSSAYSDEQRRDSSSNSPMSLTPDPNNDMTFDIINKMRRGLSASPLLLCPVSPDRRQGLH